MRDYRDLINEISTQFGLDSKLVEAICLQESSLQTNAYRFEVGFWKLYLRDHPDYQDVIPGRVSSSYGLMQVMYPTARQMGFKGEPEELFLPRVGLTWGCKYYAHLLKWAAGNHKKALAAYNGGPGNWAAKKPQAYAAKVYANWQQMS